MQKTTDNAFNTRVCINFVSLCDEIVHERSGASFVVRTHKMTFRLYIKLTTIVSYIVLSPSANCKM